MSLAVLDTSLLIDLQMEGSLGEQVLRRRVELRSGPEPTAAGFPQDLLSRPMQSRAMPRRAAFLALALLAALPSAARAEPIVVCPPGGLVLCVCVEPAADAACANQIAASGAGNAEGNTAASLAGSASGDAAAASALGDAETCRLPDPEPGEAFVVTSAVLCPAVSVAGDARGNNAASALGDADGQGVVLAGGTATCDSLRCRAAAALLGDASCADCVAVSAGGNAHASGTTNAAVSGTGHASDGGNGVAVSGCTASSPSGVAIGLGIACADGRKLLP